MLIKWLQQCSWSDQLNNFTLHQSTAFFVADELKHHITITDMLNLCFSITIDMLHLIFIISKHNMYIVSIKIMQ